MEERGGKGQREGSSRTGEARQRGAARAEGMGGRELTKSGDGAGGDGAAETASTGVGGASGGAGRGGRRRKSGRGDRRPGG